MRDEAIVKWLPDGRNVELLRRLEFRCSLGHVWIVPRGAVVNGASIPRWLWRAIGCPFVGKYRTATILHDYHCDLRVRPSWKVHRMFWDKMRADGCGVCQAWVMWLGVRVFGPRF